MFKKVIFLVFLIIISGCSVKEYTYDFVNENSKDVSIVVRKWDDEGKGNRIENKRLINKFLKSIKSASNISTGNIDFPTPGYKVSVFTNNKKKVVFGYYTEEKDYGIVGRYVDYENSIFIGSDFKIPNKYLD